MVGGLRRKMSGTETLGGAESDPTCSRRLIGEHRHQWREGVILLNGLGGKAWGTLARLDILHLVVSHIVTVMTIPFYVQGGQQKALALWSGKPKSQARLSTQRT